MSKQNTKPTVNKAMKAIAELTAEELANKELDLRKEKFLLRGQSKTGKLQSPALIRKARRNLARVLTEQTKRANAAK